MVNPTGLRQTTTNVDTRSCVAPHATPPGIARSWLLHSAAALGCGATLNAPDVIVLDLEDAVPEIDKSNSREAVVAELRSTSAWVRINDAATPHWRQDLDALCEVPGLAGVVLAKAETADDVTRTAGLLPVNIPIVPMIESALALQHVEQIASHPATFRIAFGVGDFMRDTGISADPVALAYVRTRLVIASIAAGIPAPIDGPARGSAAAVRASLSHSKAIGMTGALVLDTSSIAKVNSAFSPSEDELGWARAVILRTDDGSRDGSYAPALARARKLIELHEQLRATVGC